MTSDTGSGAPRGDIASPTSGHGATSERAKLVLGWLVVLVPAAWGVSQVVVKSAALFGR